MGKTNKTFSVTDEYHEIFEERRKELGMTVTAYFENIIDTEHKKAVAATPVEVVKDNPEHLKRIEELESKIDSSKEFNEGQLNEEKEKYTRLVKVYNELKVQSEQSDNRRFVDNSETVLQIDPINVQILNYVAIREGKKRKQEWSISDVVNYFIHSRFEKGTLNGDLSSVPDNIINQMRRELENGNI
jgi:hypothetical protein